MKDQTAKLSKRNGDASFEDLLAKGYLTEAVINYIALLGWAPKGEQEIYSLEELAEEFDISGISKSAAIFDPVKLKAINAEYIRKMTPEQFCEYITPYIKKYVKRDDIDYKVLASVLQPRTELYTDIEELIDFIDVLPEYDNALYCHKKMKTNEETSIEALNAILPVLEALDEWNVESIHTALFDLIAKLEVKNGWLLWPLRTAVSGKPVTAGGGVELCAILGKEEAIARIKKGIAQLS
jgi:glutamyl-tRNA synthetase